MSLSHPEPRGSDTVVDLVRRWAVSLRTAEDGSPDLDQLITRFAEELADQRDRARLAADWRFTELYRRCPTGVLLIGADGRITAANPAFVRLFGAHDDNAVRGTRMTDLGATRHDRTVLGDLLAASGADQFPEQVRIRVADDSVKPVQVTTTVLPGERGGEPVLMVEDVQELHQLRETFQHQGLHDPLTGLPNNAYFRSRLEAVLGDEHEHDSQVALLYFDLDGFKVISDGLGSDAADLVLRGVADTLRAAFATPTDTDAIVLATDDGPAEDGHADAGDPFLARLFGDTFAVVLRGRLRPAEVVAAAEAAIDRLAAPMQVDGIGVGVSASVGIAVVTLPGPETAELMRSAELALHRAKELGKAQWVLYDAKSGEADRDRNRLACAIAGALESGEVTVAYQPHVVLPDAQIVTSLNVALRWDHPTLGRLRPPRFYPLAETTGMTVPLGRHLLTQAVRTAADWRARFGAESPVVCLTLPRRMAVDADLVGMVRAALTDNDLPPSKLMLCTDGASLLDNRGDVLESIGHLVDFGITFVLDITGPCDMELVSSLRIPAAAVMLSGPLVEDLDADEPPEHTKVSVQRLVERAESIGLKVGAHGVQSREHAQRLFDLGVVVGSGPFAPEHSSKVEAERWVGHIWPMG